MTMTRKLLSSVAIAGVLMFSHVTFAADSSICREGLDKQVQALNLNDAQKSKIKPILDNLKSTMKQAGSQMGGLEDQLNQQVFSPAMDQAKANSIVDQKTQLIGNMMKAKVSATNQIFSVLTPDQKTKLQDSLKKQEEKMASLFKGCYED